MGYAKTGTSKWGISLRDLEGNEFEDRIWKHEEWLFNDAPRALRILAVDKLPALLDTLIEQVQQTRQKITEKIADAGKVTAAIKTAVPGDKPSGAQRRK